VDPFERELLHRYAALFNARDWDGLRALLARDCELDLVSRTRRRGAEVGEYYARYSREQVHLVPGLLEGRPALGAHADGQEHPSYFVIVGWDGDRVATIRDFRYVPYIAADAEFVALPPFDEG
jgi:RNA polymerase sigma-70 factor (ECF subfamily)